MTSASLELHHDVGRAFDSQATEYDEVFTRSTIGRAQRNAVWERAASLFARGSHILELNCGTGEDALFLSRLGMSVVACDASEQMIEQARQRQKEEDPRSTVRFEHLPIEQLTTLPIAALFDGVFSNFSGLNCVSDLEGAAKQLAHLVKDGAPLLLCLSTRICLWEIFYYLFRGNVRKAFRRCNGRTDAQLGGVSFPVYYHSIHQLRVFFEPTFKLKAYTGIGIVVPPSYLESWARKHPRFLRLLQQIDATVCNWPLFRVVGDHVLLQFERA
jgi:ubiquinone/menaquinone biosynthesis C-methylase UbiE